MSKGVLQPDMWGVTPSDRWDWPGVRQSVAQHGVRNSLLVAPMPTASTSQVYMPAAHAIILQHSLAVCMAISCNELLQWHTLLSAKLPAEVNS